MSSCIDCTTASQHAGQYVPSNGDPSQVALSCQAGLNRGLGSFVSCPSFFGGCCEVCWAWDSRIEGTVGSQELVGLQQYTTSAIVPAATFRSSSDSRLSHLQLLYGSLVRRVYPLCGVDLHNNCLQREPLPMMTSDAGCQTLNP